MDCLDQIIAREGGLTDDPIDKGKRTKYGISQAAHPDVDLDALTPEGAKDIYRREYLERPGINQIPDERLRCQMLDWAVNSGPRIAIRALQHILDVVQDGVLGEQTLAALASREPKDVNNRLAIYRIAFLYDIVRANPSQRKFIHGWVKRAQSFLIP